MNKEVHHDIDINDESDIIVTETTEKSFIQVQKEMQDVLSGKKMNRDGKRILCNEMNTWIDWITGNNWENILHYRLNLEGNIVSYYPKDDKEIPPNPDMLSGDLGPYGKIS